MIEYILTVAIILIVFLVHSCVIKPKKAYDRYVRDITALGYKVHALPFAPFRFPFLEKVNEGSKEGDPLKFWKVVCPTIDVIVGNSMN